MKLKRLLALLAVMALVAAACGGDDDAEQPTTTAGETTTTAAATTTTAAATTTTAAATTTAAPMVCSAAIGTMLPVTGPAASIGEEQLNWAKLAVDRFNGERGSDFSLVEGDTMLDPAQGAIVAPQMVSNDAVVAVVGPAGSQVVDAAGPIFEEAGMVFISPSATQTDLTAKYTTFFRVVPTDDVQGPSNANFMMDQGATKVFVVDDQSSYSTGLADQTIATLEAGNVDVTRESVSQDASDFSALVSQVAEDTDFVYLPWQLAANAQIFGQQLQEQGKDITIFGSDGLFSPSDFTVDGSFVSAFAPDIRGIPEDAELVEAFTSQYGNFGTFGPPVFAAVIVLMEAAQSICDGGEEPTREAMLAAVGATNLSESILGQPIAFDDNGDIADAKWFIFQISDGSYELVLG